MGEIDHLSPGTEAAIKIAAVTTMVTGLVAGCEQKPLVDPSGNTTEPTPALVTSAPEATEPVSSTGTPIVEATPAAPSVQEAALAFGWRNDRQYTEGERDGQTCALDTFNQACMAVFDKDTNSWVEIDETTTEGAELKYGHLVPENSTLNTQNERFGNGYRELDVSGHYLDRYSRSATFNGEAVTEEVVKVGLRDIDGMIHVAEVVYDVVGANIVDHLSPFHFGFENDPGADAVVGEDTGIDPLETIKPSHHLRIHVPFPTSDTSNRITVPSFERSINEPKANNQADITLAELYNQNVEDQLTLTEWEKLKNGYWLDRQITIYGAAHTQIVLATENDILKYLSPGSTISQ